MQWATLRQVVSVVRETYCGRIGVEFMHIQDAQQKAWIQMAMEGSRNRANLTPGDKLEILRQLDEAEGFERFLDIKYPGTKRFSLEGSENIVPALETLIEGAAAWGVRDVTIGMAHRGRLNVLTSIMGKSYAAVFSEFQGEAAHPADVQGSGDVKYHLGVSTDRDLPDGTKIHLSLTPNPSHLEAVNPVVLGKVRAKQILVGDTERAKPAEAPIDEELIDPAVVVRQTAIALVPNGKWASGEQLRDLFIKNHKNLFGLDNEFRLDLAYFISMN